MRAEWAQGVPVTERCRRFLEGCKNQGKNSIECDELERGLVYCFDIKPETARTYINTMLSLHLIRSGGSGWEILLP